MSELIIQPVKIDAIKEHPNAQRLEIAVIGGYEIITGIGNHQAGDIVVHVPPDAMVPRPLACEWGVDPYLSWRGLVDDDAKGRVKAAKLRGITSFGFIVDNESGASLGTDLKEHYGIVKYEPPVSGIPAGQTRYQHPLFHRYTDIQNLRNYKDKFHYREPTVVTEKLHGTNSRIGWVKRQIPDLLPLETLDLSDDKRSQAYNEAMLEKVVGTHRTQRKLEDCGIYGLPLERHEAELDKLLEWAKKSLANPASPDEPETLNSLIVFGEIYGAGVQKGLIYGKRAEKGYAIFDISINGVYMPFLALKHVCGKFGLPVVPVLASGIFDFDEILEMAEGDTLLEDTHIREGIVIRPMGLDHLWKQGAQDPNPKRTIFKVVSGAYLTSKGMTDFH